MDGDDTSDSGHDPTVVGVVLAAGTGSRFADAGRSGGDESVPENKLLATLEGEALVRRAARSLAVPAVDRTIAVVGHDAAAVRDAVADAVDETVENPAFAEGQGTSVAIAARRAWAHGADVVCFLPGDMPCVSPATTSRVLEAVETPDGTPDAVVPTYDDRRGNPVAFGASQFQALASLSGDVGGRALFDGIDVRRIPVEDPGVHRDVDTVDDLEELREVAEAGVCA